MHSPLVPEGVSASISLDFMRTGTSAEASKDSSWCLETALSWRRVSPILLIATASPSASIALMTSTGRWEVA